MTNSAQVQQNLGEPKILSGSPKDIGLPHDSWRRAQKEAIDVISNPTVENIEKLVKAGGTYFKHSDSDKPQVTILVAPTGLGKSACAVYTASTAKFKGLGRSLVLTSTKQLQDTYLYDYGASDRVQTVKGRSNYECIHPAAETGTTVDGAICLSPESKVLRLSDLRWIRLGDVTVGEKILGCDEGQLGGHNRVRINTSRRKWRVSTVQRVISRVAPVYRLHLSDGTSIDATEDHPFLVGSYNMFWAPAKKLKTTLRRALSVWEDDVSYESGWLAGMFDGEGSLGVRENELSKRHGYDLAISQSQKNSLTVSDIKTTLSGKGFDFHAAVNLDAKRNREHALEVIRVKGGTSEVLRFLGSIRPKRLLSKFKPPITEMSTKPVTLIRREFVGNKPVINLETDTHTFIADGIVTHNCNAGYRCPFKNQCLYYSQRDIVENVADIASLTYAYFLPAYNYANVNLGGRAWTIADEAHMLEDELINFAAISVSKKSLIEKGLNLPKDVESVSSWIEWFSDVEFTIKEKLVSIEKTLARRIEGVSGLEGASMDRETKKLIQEKAEFSSLLSKMGKLSVSNIKWIASAYNDRVTISPLWPEGLYQEYIGKASERSLWMSATMTGGPRIAEFFGITDYQYIEVPSSFPAADRKFIYKPIVNITRATMLTEVPKLAKLIDSVMQKYPDKKGMIHCVSNKLRDAILIHLKDKSRVIIHDSKDRDKKLDEFRYSKKPLVMFSPSFHTGVDLPGILSFQVIAKIPWGDIGDKKIKARKEDGDKGEAWYIQDAVGTLCQSYGRGVRRVGDVCSTYCFDRQFGALYSRGKEYMPQWFKEAIVWSN